MTDLRSEQQPRGDDLYVLTESSHWAHHCRADEVTLRERGGLEPLAARFVAAGVPVTIAYGAPENATMRPWCPCAECDRASKMASLRLALYEHRYTVAAHLTQELAR